MAKPTSALADILPIARPILALTKSLKIAVASTGLGLISRGIETWAADLAEALNSQGVTVALFQGGGVATHPYACVLGCLPREGSRNARWAARIPRGLDWRLALTAGYALEQTTFAWSLAKVLRREHFDILHVQDPILALWMERLRRIGFIRTKTILAHGTEEPPEFLMKFRYVQHLAPTHMERLRALGFWRPTWTAIGNFVDVDRFHPGSAPEVRRRLGIRDDAFVVLTLAAIRRTHKRIDWLIKTFEEFRREHPDIPAVLLIAGGREDDTDALIAEGTRRLGDSVRFLVRQPREDIPDLCRAANVFVLASLFEMLPIALLEAGASGLPCVIHADPTLRWATGPGGVPISMEDSVALSEALYALGQNPAQRLELAQAARSHAVETFETAVVVDQILAYYQAVMGGP